MGVSPSGRRFCPCRQKFPGHVGTKPPVPVVAETLRSGPSRSSGDIFHKCEEVGRSRDVRSRRISRHLSPSEIRTRLGRDATGREVGTGR